jgi:hypothetical protein
VKPPERVLPKYYEAKNQTSGSGKPFLVFEGFFPKSSDPLT